MRIDRDFPGGNIQVNRIEGDDVYLEQEIRDTTEWWFYWAFRVTGAQGRTLTFHFENRDVVGYWGPCVSTDDKAYAWAGAASRPDGHTFTHTFGPQDACVYFRYAWPYQLSTFDAWCNAQTAPMRRGTLCTTERGRALPYVVIGDARAPRSIFFTSRHHACESMGTHALIGAADRLIARLGEITARGYNLIVVPLIDLDGVEDGDQGKSRAPHDHNRDYIDEPVYAVIRAMRGLVREHPPEAFVDFHCPWFLGQENDHLYLVKADPDKYAIFDAFGGLLIAETARDPAPDAIRYDGKWDVRAGEKWLTPEPNPATSSSFFWRSGARFALSIEVPYFGIDTVFTDCNVHALGGHVADALLTWLGNQ